MGAGRSVSASRAGDRIGNADPSEQTRLDSGARFGGVLRLRHPAAAPPRQCLRSGPHLSKPGAALTMNRYRWRPLSAASLQHSLSIKHRTPLAARAERVQLMAESYAYG